jgi:exodeoxyribonuclease-3
VLTRSSLPGNPDDRQARYIEAAVNGVLITSIYLPNGNPQPGPKFDYKLAWFERLIEHGAELMKAGVPVVLAGDYNVVPTVQDIYPTRSLDNNALIQPQSRHAYARLLAQGWKDPTCTRTWFVRGVAMKRTCPGCFRAGCFRASRGASIPVVYTSTVP